MRDGVRQNRGRANLTGRHLKIYGCITMLFYTVSLSIFQNALLHVNSHESMTQLGDAMAGDPKQRLFAAGALATQLIGALAIPIFAFLLVEGFVHTSDFRRYLLSILLCGVVSELPYDFAVSGTWWTMSGQNLMFTYVICLCMLYGLRLFVGKQGVVYRFMQIFVVAAALLWSIVLNTAFGTGSILLVAAYYLFYERKGLRVLIGCGVSLLYLSAPLSGYAIWNYSGRRGKIKHKYVFYALYPLHLLLCGLAAHLLGA